MHIFANVVCCTQQNVEQVYLFLQFQKLMMERSYSSKVYSDRNLFVGVVHVLVQFRSLLHNSEDSYLFSVVTFNMVNNLKLSMKKSRDWWLNVKLCWGGGGEHRRWCSNKNGSAGDKSETFQDGYRNEAIGKNVEDMLWCCTYINQVLVSWNQNSWVLHLFNQPRPAI
jgi:hypothetical protein